MQRFQVAIWQEWNWWVAQCLELDIATQAGSEPEVLENAREALKLYFAEPCAGSPTQAPPGIHIPADSATVELCLDDH
jgi:predicted RNase H-like HicB family nuclease